MDVDGSCEMMNLHTNGTAIEQNHQSVVTMAEVSSQEITSAEVPKQPQAISCASEQQGLSTVYVQKPSSLQSLPSISSGVVPRAMSEHHAPKIRLLTRTPAMRSMSSPPPSFQLDDQEINTLSVKNSISSRGQSLDSCDSSQSGHSGKIDDYLVPKNSISRDSSFDYTDSTGVDLEEFIIQTLKNPRDKKMLLRLESDFTNFINDPSRPILHYPPMTSYHRMIVHRVAAYFGMDHNVDMTGKSVVMNKTMNTRIPEFKFREFLSRENSEEDSTGNGPRTILKRESLEEGTPPKVESPKPSTVVHPLEEKRSKSFEEREEEYSKARARIFNQESMSSQSSQSSKDGGDLEPIQILQATRDGESTESEYKELQPPNDEQAPFEPEKSQNQDDSPSQKSEENKPKDEPKTTVNETTVTEKPQQQQQAYKSYGGSKGRQHSGSTSALPSWAAEGAPLMPPTLDPSGLHMFPYPGLQGMVPVMPPSKPVSIPEYHAQPTGGVVWNFPVDAMQQPTRPHGPQYMTPPTGVQLMTPDGMAVYPPPYNMTAVKPTAHGPVSYMQHPQHQSATPSQSIPHPAPVQSPPHQQHQAQMMIPQQFYSMQQPVYYVPPQPRHPYPTQQPLDPNQRWAAPGQQPPPQVAQSPTSPSYPDISHQFAGMSLVPRPTEVEAQQQSRPSGDSTVQSQASYGGHQPPIMQNQHPHIQYVFVSPQGQYRPGVPVIAQQMPQQGSNQQHPTYVYGQQIYQGQIPQYALSTEPVLQPRSQTPPTPPRTTSPIISSPQFPPHPVTQAGPNSQQMTRPQQTLTPPYQPRTPPHTPSTRPFLIQGPHGLPLPPTHVVPVGHAATGTPPQHIPTSPSAIVFSQGQMFQPPQQIAQRKTSNDRRLGKADVYIPDNTVKSHSSPITTPTQAVNPGMQYWTGHNVGTGYHPPAQLSLPRHDLNQQRFLQGQAIAHYQHQYQYQMQQFTKNKQRPYKQRQGPRPSSSDSTHNKRTGGGGITSNPGLSNQDSDKSTDTSSSITTSSGTGASHILEVYDYPEGIKNHQADLLFDELKKTGARIQWLSNSGPSSSPPQGGGSSVLLAIFSSSAQAQRALDTINSSSYKLRVPPHHTVLQKTSDGSLKNS